MARTSGRLAGVDVTGGVNTMLYTAPSDLRGSIKTTLAVCNRNNADVKIRIALLDGVIGTLADEDYIEYDVTIRANGVLQRKGIVLAAGDVLGVYTNKSNVTFQVWGE